MLYRDIILHHYRYPAHFGSLESPTCEITRKNPLCGDVITMQLQVQKNQIMDVAFSGESCAICRASASLLTSYIQGKKLSDIATLDHAFMTDLIGGEIVAGRVKCLLLPLEAVKLLVSQTDK